MNEQLKREGSCLHLVAAASADALDACRSQFGPDDAILFLDAGVLHLLNDKPQSHGNMQAVYYSIIDLKAQGIYAVAVESGVQMIDDQGFVRLLGEFAHCLSWK